MAAEANAKLWQMNLRNADIRGFITQVSTITGKSFIIDPRIKGNVTVISNTQMDADAIYALFLSVLRVHGYAAIPTGNVIRIVQQVLAKQSGNDSQDRKSEEIITRVIPVKNTPSIELVKILRPLIPQYGHLAGLSQPNALIVNDHASNITRLIKIIKEIDVADESMTVVVELKEAWVEDMVALLEKLAPLQIGKSAKGPNKVTIVASERTNSLILRADPAILTKMIDLIKILDVPANRAGTIQVVRLAHSDATELAEILRNLISDDNSGKSGQKVKTNIQPDVAINALVIRAEPTIMAEIKSIISQLDIRRLQVLIEAAIVEVTQNFSYELGTELALGNKTSSKTPIATTAPSGILAGILQSLAPPGNPNSFNLGELPIIGIGKESRNGTSFALIIQALAENSNVNLLATPSITTMDNEEAKIHVGQQVPFRTGSTTTGSGGTINPFTTIQREDVGLTLRVTPHVHDGKLIRLEINHEVSEVDQTGTIGIGAEGSADLITNKRTIETTVLIDDGEVIVLGGLIRDKVTFAEKGVPFLKDIPILGYLFKSTTRKQEKQNLLVFIRATVLKSKEDVDEQTKRKYSSIWEVEITGRDPLEAINDLFDGKH